MPTVCLIHVLKTRLEVQIVSTQWYDIRPQYHAIYQDKGPSRKEREAKEVDQLPQETQESPGKCTSEKAISEAGPYGGIYLNELPIKVCKFWR